MFAVGLACLLALGGITVLSVPGLSKPIRGFFTTTDLDIIPYEVKPAALPITVTDKGALESSKNQDVLCQVEGSTTIISILAEGTKVKKGDLVCELDSASLNDSLTNQKIATQGAEASFQNAKLTREVAEIAVKEYEEGIFLQDKATCEGEIKLAESDLARSSDRVDWAVRMYEKGYVSKAAKVSEELNFQKAKFALEQAESKLHVLLDYTKGKTIKELRSEVEKARSDELAKEQTFQLEKTKEAKLVKQIINCKLFAPGDGIVVYANDTIALLRQQRASDRGRGDRSRAAEDLQPAGYHQDAGQHQGPRVPDRQDHARHEGKDPGRCLLRYRARRHGARRGAAARPQQLSSART